MSKDPNIIASLVAFNGTKKANMAKTPDELIRLWEDNKIKKKDEIYLPYLDKYHAQMLEVAKGFERFKDKDIDLSDIFNDDPMSCNYKIKDLDSLSIAFKQHKPTPIERMMAYRLVENKINFTYQKRIDINGEAQGRSYFVCDFVLDGKKVIEVEGKIHCSEENWKKDRSKLNFLSSMGYFVFRFDWDDVMSPTDDYDIMNFIIT